MLSNHYAYTLQTRSANNNNSDNYSLYLRPMTKSANTGYNTTDYNVVADGYNQASQFAGLGTAGLLPKFIKRFGSKAAFAEDVAAEAGVATAAAPETLGLSELALPIGIAATYALHLVANHYYHKAADVRDYNDRLYDRYFRKYNDNLSSQSVLDQPGTAGLLGSSGRRMPNVKATPPPTEPE